MAAVAPKTTGAHNLGTADLRWGTVYTGNVNASGNVTISGNLSIIGNASEITVDNLSVAEPLIKLANGNTADTIDIGIYAQYNDGQDKYSVLYRDASDGKWKLATGLTEEPVPGSDIDLTGLATTTLVVDVLESNTLTGTDADGDVTVTPNGTGHVLLVTDTVCLGEAGDAAVSLITPTGVDLVVRTGDTNADPADNSGSITINAGDNGNIDITPHGTGEVNISKVDIDGGTIDGATIATSDITVGAGNTLDVSAGTLTLADDQISGDKVEGGTINSVTINSLVAGTADINGGTVDGATIATSDITVGAGNTLDVSAGTLTLADDQISGDKVEGGTINSVTINSLVAGTADINGGTVDGATIATSDITVGAGKTLDVSAGTLTLADDQISGDKVEGGTISSIAISQLSGPMNCNSQAMTNVDINSGAIDGTAIGSTSASTGKFTNVEVSGTLDIGSTGNITISRSNNAALTIRSSDSSTNYIIIDTQDDDAGLNVFGKLNLTKGLQLGVTSPSDNTELDITRSVVLLGNNVDVTLPAAANHTGRQFIVIVTGTSVTIDHANGSDPIYSSGGSNQVAGGAWSLPQHGTYTFISTGSAWYAV